MLPLNLQPSPWADPPPVVQAELSRLRAQLSERLSSTGAMERELAEVCWGKPGWPLHPAPCILPLQLKTLCPTPYTSKLYTLHLKTLYPTSYTSKHYALHPIPQTLHLKTLCPAPCTSNPTPQALHLKTLCPTAYTSNPMPYTLVPNPRPAPSSLHPAACSLQPAPCTPHPAACTPHPTACAPHPAACAPHPAACAPHPAACAPHPAACALNLDPSSSHPHQAKLRISTMSATESSGRQLLDRLSADVASLRAELAAKSR